MALPGRTIKMKRVIGVLVALTTVLSAAPSASARMDLPRYAFTQPAEDFGRVGPLIKCEYTWRAGVVAFGDMVEQASGYSYLGPRRCSAGKTTPTSHHETGRALDIMIDHRVPDQQADGHKLMVYLMSKDAAKLRRLGVVEIIWGGKIWTTSRDSGNITSRLSRWRVHQNCAPGDDPTFCHYNHIHLSLSVEGSEMLSTFWTAQPSG